MKTLTINKAVTHTALGMNVSKAEPGATLVIRASDLPQASSYFPDTQVFKKHNLEPGRSLERASVYPDDVILVARGGQLRIGIASPAMEGAVIGNNLLLLRTNPEILQGAVLAAWLGSPRGQHELKKCSRSSNSMMMSLRTADVLKLQVPVPSMDQQTYISQLLYQSSQAHHAAIAAADLRAQLVQARCTELLEVS